MMTTTTETGSSLMTMLDKSGKTALHYCSENTETTIARHLLSLDRTILDVQDENGHSALHLAVIVANVVIVMYLLQQGSDVYVEDNEKHTVSHWAAGPASIRFTYCILYTLYEI